MQTIADHWSLFSTLILTEDIGEVQRREMRRAFYAGFQSALCSMTELAEEDPDEKEAAAALNGLHVEGHKFALDVLEGKA